MADAQTKINIKIDDSTMSATLADNIATKALIDKLQSGPVTVTMDNYGGFEKVGSLPWSLPSADSRITTEPGDIMLYTSNSIVIFYGQNTWSYTPLGVLETTSPTQIHDFVGNGTKQVIISLADPAGTASIETDIYTTHTVHTADGKPVVERPLRAGLYIIDNKKVIIR